ncbi:hypothetical protein Tco_0981122, partial [Tanacetum coccineum]
MGKNSPETVFRQPSGGGRVGQLALRVAVVASGGVESRVRESDGGDRIDREMGRIFGVGRKTPPENFSDGGGVMVTGSGGGGGWPDSLREKREFN